MAKASSLWIRFSRYSCFLASISSVSRRRARASWALGAGRARVERVPLKNLPNLLMAEQWGASVPALWRQVSHSRSREAPGNQQVVSAGDTHSRAFPGQARPRPPIATRERGQGSLRHRPLEVRKPRKVGQARGPALSALGAHPKATADKVAQRKANPCSECVLARRERCECRWPTWICKVLLCDCERVHSVPGSNLFIL